MIRKVDPLANAAPLIERVYAYVAYRIGHGPDAEDVVSATFERAVRYRHAYDPSRGEPIVWLIGIAKHCLIDALSARRADVPVEEAPELAASFDLEQETVRRIHLRSAVEQLSDRDQELLALRYGADLSTREIARLVEAKPNAVDVALHRALARLRQQLEQRERRDDVAALDADPTVRVGTLPE